MAYRSAKSKGRLHLLPIAISKTVSHWLPASIQNAQQLRALKMFCHSNLPLLTTDQGTLRFQKLTWCAGMCHFLVTVQ